MALRDNSIGPYNFIALMGEVVIPSYAVLADDRPGVDGTEFTIGGLKGSPFQLVSQVDCENYAAARALYANYLLLRNDVPQVLVQGGVTSVTDAYAVKVLNVTGIRFLTIRGAVGNTQGASPNEGFLEARWELISVPT